MLTASQLAALARQAPEDLMSWSSFVAQTEFVWQDPACVADTAGWRTLWFEMEILNGLALAEWEEDGSARDWSSRWREGYEQDARGLVSQLLPLLAG